MKKKVKAYESAEMKEYCYSFDEMRELLHNAQGVPMAETTLKRKIHSRSGVPPSIKTAPGVYWFPKDLFSDWIRALPKTFEVKNAG